MPGGRNEEVELEQRLELAAFLKQLMTDARYRTQAEFGKDIGVEASRISHWLKGEERGPSAYSLLTAIRKAEARKERLGVKADAQETSVPRPESFEGQVLELSGLMREAIVLLREARPAKPAKPQSRRRATGTDG